MPRNYGEKASEKVSRTMHEFKRGTLRSGSGGKVTSRKQALAIGLAQARRSGFKVPPPPQGHSTLSLDARVRGYLSAMPPGKEIDARGIARALGGVDPLEADYALERAEKAGLAVTRDGRWFEPVGGTDGVRHAKKKSRAALDREIAEALAGGEGEISLKDRSSGFPIVLKVRAGRVVGAMGSDPKRYVGLTLDEAKYLARYGGAQRVRPTNGRTEALKKKQELKDLELRRADYLRALGYAENTHERVRQLHQAIDDISARMKLLK